MKVEYFTAEMRRLNEAAQAFAEKHPEQARMLNLHELREKDPYVERLLEGVAFLTAQIQARIDDDIPEISEALLNQIVPHLLRPYPSATIMQLTPNFTDKMCAEVPRNSQFSSIGDEKTPACTFRTTSPVVTNPLTVKEFSASDSPLGGSVFRIKLETYIKNSSQKLRLNDLRFHVHADPALAVMIYYALTASVRSIRLDREETYGEQYDIGEVSRHALKPCCYDVDDSMLPISGRSFPGTRILHDYFSFKQRFLFFTIDELQLGGIPEDCRNLIVTIHSDIRLPSEYKLSADQIRVNCAPAINLSEQSMSGGEVNHQQIDYPLHVSSMKEEKKYIYNVDCVSLKYEDDIQEIYSLQSFRHRESSDKPYYHIKRQNHQHQDKNIRLALGGDTKFNSYTLSVEGQLYDGDLPYKSLREGTITEIDSSGKQVTFTCNNISRPTRVLMPPDQQGYRWALISHLSNNYQTIDSAEKLKDLLRMYDWTNKIENRKCINGIEHLSVGVVEVIHRASLRRGIEFQLTFDDEQYTSVGDMYLFASVLHRFFSTYASMNMYVQTRVYESNTHGEWLWQEQLDDKYQLLSEI